MQIYDNRSKSSYKNYVNVIIFMQFISIYKRDEKRVREVYLLVRRTFIKSIKPWEQSLEFYKGWKVYACRRFEEKKQKNK